MAGAPRKPDPIDVEVGRRIRTRRMLMDMSQKGLAQALGVTYQQVQKYETGRSKVGAGRLQTIANVLDVPPSYFFENTSAGAPDRVKLTPEQAASFLESPMGLALNRAFARISDARVRRAFLDLVRWIAEKDAALEQETGKLAESPK